MDYFLFVLGSRDTQNTDTFTDFVERITKENKENALKASVGKLVLTDTYYRTAKVVTDEWIPVETISPDSHTVNKTNDLEEGDNKPAQTSEENQCLGRRLLELSESLPYGGISVHVVLFNPNLQEDTENSESYLPLYGSLKKLACWHNAQVILAIQGQDVTPSVQDLADFTGGFLSSDLKAVKLEQSLWRGKVSVMNKMDGQGHVFPGFQLQCESGERKQFYKRLQRLCSKSSSNTQIDVQSVPVFGRMLEVLDQVDSRTIPPFMLTSYTLQLSVWKQNHHSDILMQELLEQEQTAVIARLAVYSHNCMVDCSQKLSAQAWKESLMANIDYAQEREEDLLNSVHFLYVLLMKNDSPDHIKAVVLHDSTEINTCLFNLESTMCKRNHGQYTEKKSVSYLDGLLDISGNMLEEISIRLTRIQTQMLQDWIDELEKLGEPTVISSDMLWKFLGDIQESFLETLVKDGVISADHQDQAESLPTLESDLALDPLEWPERHALQQQDTQQREMRRYQSSESMCLSSPLHADEAGTTVDVKDFLKLFKPDGNASIDKLSPIRQSLNLPVENEEPSLAASPQVTPNIVEWQQDKYCKGCKLFVSVCDPINCVVNIVFHALSYYKHNISEKNEKHFSHLREKYLKQETCSSFTTKTILTKKKIAGTTDRRQRSGGHNLMSPNRKSPRGPRVVIGLKKEEEDVRPSLSQPSRQKLMLQHPGLKSPRKRQYLPSQQLRRSPRKQPSATFQRLKSDGDIGLPPPPKRKRRSDPDLLDQSLDDSFSSTKSGASTSDAAKKPSRSERHKKKLEEICRSVLVKHGVDETDTIFKSCAEKLFQVTKFFVKALPNSRNLSQEMKNIAEGQVTQVVDLEKRRQEMRKTSKK